MFKVDDLVLMTGDEIILKDYLVKIEQPSIKQIASIGEGKFFRSLNIFVLISDPLIEYIQSLEQIGEEEKNQIITAITSYDNLLFLMKLSEIETEDGNNLDILTLAQAIFGLMFPNHKFIFNEETNSMFLMSQDEDSNSIVVDRELFEIIKDVAKQIFLLDTFLSVEKEQEMSEAAKAIADKIAKAEARIQGSKGEKDDTGYFARILSIMGVTKDLDYLSNLTVYQLNNQFERMNLFTSHKQGMQALLAGAPNVEIVDWYKKI